MKTRAYPYPPTPTPPHIGAMENWGLVTYRETALLIDPEHSSSDNKQWVALVVGHELAHQWFGNLVTMVSLLTTPPFLIL